MVPYLVCAVCFRQLSGAGPESQYLVGQVAGRNAAMREDNAIRAGSILKITRLLGAGPVEPAIGKRTPTGAKHEVVKGGRHEEPFSIPIAGEFGRPDRSNERWT
jgi:hypothetical protein